MKFKQIAIGVLIICLAGLFFVASSIADLFARQKLNYAGGQCTFIQNWFLENRGVHPIDYNEIRTLSSERDQIKAIITEASTWPCLAHNHWFRIGFDPYHESISLSDDILDVYKNKQETVWIYIQHNYRDLNALTLGIDVEVSFDGVPQNIFIPYESVTWFDDPEYEFLLKPWSETDK